MIVRREGEILLTVIVLTYNQEQYIEEAIASIASQETSFRFRILIHDDASTDGTAEILRSLASRWPEKIDLILREDNLLTQGRNVRPAVLLGVSTKYVAWCDGDDYWTDTTKLQKQVDFMEANDWCSVCHHGVDLKIDVGADEMFVRSNQTLLDLEHRSRRRAPGVETVNGNTICISSVVVRRDSLRNEALTAMVGVPSGDWLLYCLALEDGDLGYLPERMSIYRMHVKNMWSGHDVTFYHAAHLRCLTWLATYSRGAIQAQAAKNYVSFWLEDNVASALHEIEHLTRERDQAWLDLKSIRQSRTYRVALKIGRVTHLLRRFIPTT